MKMSQFQPLLLKAAVNLIACDGYIDDVEVLELRKIAENEMYFAGFDYVEELNTFINAVKTNGKESINSFLSEISRSEIKERQKFILLEVLIRVMESDDKIELNEMKFIQLVKTRLYLSDEELILHFPDKLSYLLDKEETSFQNEFTDDIEIDQVDLPS